MRIGPVWCEERKQWLFLIEEDNRFILRSAKLSDDKWSEEIITEGVWTVYYENGEKDLKPKTYVLSNKQIYRTDWVTHPATKILSIDRWIESTSCWFPYKGSEKPFEGVQQPIEEVSAYNKLSSPPELPKKKLQIQITEQTDLIGPYWCAKTDAWIRFVIFENKFVPQQAHRTNVPDIADAWETLELDEGLWDTYYEEGRNDSQLTTFKLVNGVLYKTNWSVNNLSKVLVVFKMDLAEGVHWVQHRISSNNPFSDHKKEQIALTPFNQLPLTVEMLNEKETLMAKEKQRAQEHWQTFRTSTVSALFEDIKRTMLNEHEFFRQEFQGLDFVGYISKEDICVGLENDIIDILHPLLDTNNAQNCLDKLQELIDNDKDNEFFRVSARTNSTWNETLKSTVFQGKTIDDLTRKVLQKIKFDYFVVFAKEFAKGVAKEFGIVKDFTQINPPRPKKSTEQLVNDISNAVNTAQTNYSNWYQNLPAGQNLRGPNGFFTWFRHTQTGQQRAVKLKQTVMDIGIDADARYSPPEKLSFMLMEINDFLCDKKTGYHTHSFSSFLLDELIKINAPELPWSKLTLVNRHYDRNEVENVNINFNPPMDVNSPN